MGGRYRRGRLGVEKIFFTDEKIFRIGALPCGGNQNYVVYVRDDCRKYDVPADKLLRGEKEQGGPSVMVSLGVCHKGIGAVRFSPQGERLTAETKSGRNCDGNGNASPPLEPRAPPICAIALRFAGVGAFPLGPWECDKANRCGS